MKCGLNTATLAGSFLGGSTKPTAARNLPSTVSAEEWRRWFILSRISSIFYLRTFNAFGCLDNLAWIWVLEKDVKGKGGAELLPTEVGLGKKYVRKSLTDAFRKYLDRRQEWLANLIDFRDSLAHRIPLFIPPYVVPAPNIEKYQALDAAAFGEPGRDPVEYERLKTEQKALVQFVPGMTHSIYEKAPDVEFHSQLLNDYVTLDEYGRTLLEELDR